jgi:hypothetical protein
MYQTQCSKPGDPDYLMESIWFTVNCSMQKFYRQIKQKHCIDKWSVILNKLNEEKKYEDIAKNIMNFFAIFLIDYMKNYNLIVDNIYDGNIILTNIKRWEKESLKISINKLDNYNTIINYFKIFIAIFKINKNDPILQLFKNIDDLVIFENINDFIIFALKNNKPLILDSLANIFTYGLLFDAIITIYPIMNKYQQIKFTTLCNKFNKFGMS